MKLMSDIQSPWLLHTKGILFLVVGLLAAALLFVQIPSLENAALLGITIWAFCRFYYYLFYVLERYLGREKRFAGVIDAIRFLLKKSDREEPKA